MADAAIAAIPATGADASHDQVEDWGMLGLEAATVEKTECVG